MAEEGVNAVVFAGEQSTIHLNDSNEPSFARETSEGLRLDPQSSNAGVPTAIFPGVNPVGQPDNLQLEGPDYSDPELLGMAYAFERVAHGQQETRYAPALKYVDDGVTATGHLVGGVKFSRGELSATVRCDGSRKTCRAILEIGDGKAGMKVPVTLAAGRKKTVKVRPSKSILMAMNVRPKAKLSARLVASAARRRR